jgi:hypothetical protein
MLMCAQSFEPMVPQTGSVLALACIGYVESNVRLVHHDCHVIDQAGKGCAGQRTPSEKLSTFLPQSVGATTGLNFQRAKNGTKTKSIAE